MITPELAVELARAGLEWKPANGDRFMIPRPDLEHDVFLVSDMTIEVERLALGGGLVKFNGTTEWALDSIAQGEVVWLPREDQLRSALGEAFSSLARVYDSWVVTVEAGGEEVRVIDNDVECVYAKALLRVIGRA
ncbi:pilus assembly protein CpaE [Auraticoccus sp. F435]|uniref:Pilus assembly protein CpaE n=1 Tax=Auraticoccus cholistanensis TaxID=2656650 RepID=A0A6A9UUS9_9ACTN|nr:pilus assembly protein CpaE [Auraticoccus cholistanensis]MVA75324.1 pilus assembly protein CpaE [Auraticoccus cholistanensis]